jgi:hypothetical protein
MFPFSDLLNRRGLRESNECCVFSLRTDRSHEALRPIMERQMEGMRQPVGQEVAQLKKE